jgi:hypothetical protein
MVGVILYVLVLKEKFLEEVIAYFLLITQGPCRKPEN